MSSLRAAPPHPSEVPRGSVPTLPSWAEKQACFPSALSLEEMPCS